MKDKERPLGEHLEELRGRVISSLISIALFTGIAFYFRSQLLDLLLLASREESLIYLHPTEAFLTYLKLAVIAGLILSTPWILYQVWKFVLPALKENEEFFFQLGFLVGAALFYLGVTVAVGVGLNYSIRFLVAVGGEGLVANFSLRNYITFASLLAFATGLVFEIPLLIYLVVRLGFITPAGLRKNRKYAILVAFTTAAFITPTDLFSQIFMAVPLILLYEMSVLLVSLIFGKEGSGNA